MIYNMAYADLEKGLNYVKRFNVSAITRDKLYPVVNKVEKSKLLHFSVNPNGEAEIVQVQLTQSCSAKKKEFDYDFSDLAVKGRASRGNILTKYPIRKIKTIQKGRSTLGAIKIWYDDTTGRINTSSYGRFIGAFEEEDRIIALYNDGSYELTNYELTNRYDNKTLLEIQKWETATTISSIHYDGERKATYVKRFQIETNTLGQKFNFLPNDYVSTKLLLGTLHPEPEVEYKVRAGRSKTVEGQIKLNEFIDVKGWKALGNKLDDSKLLAVKPLHKMIETKEEEAV